MAQFDVRQLGAGLVVDCQSDLLSELSTRFVVPLIAVDQAPRPAGKLNPVFTVEGRDFVMATQFAAAIEVRELGPVVMSLGDRSFEITASLDILISGV